MKSIFDRPRLQFSGTNSRIQWMNERITFFLDRPALMLVVPWIFYFAFDLGTTLVFGLEFRGFSFANITVVTGFATSCVLFFWLIPGMFAPGGAIRYALVSLVLMLAIVVAKYFLMEYFGVGAGGWARFLILEGMRFFDFLIVTFTVWVFYALFNTVREKRKSERKYEELELAHKSLQLSPHFLLNLIGDITGKSIQFSPVLFEDLRHYTTILRYGYLDPGAFNSLASEVSTVISYLHCQRLRFGQSLAMDVDIDTTLLDRDDHFMPKMVLLTLVENIFKHGVTQDFSHPLEISAKWDEEDGRPKFLYKSKNLVKAGEVRHGGGFGLQTAQRLLGHYFKDASCHSMQDEQIYTLSLIIPYDTPYQTRPD